MAKYQEICDILVTRIQQGEYADSQLPNLRQLAEDMGVSYLTARQAVNQLKTQGILASDASGRRTLVKAELGSRPRVALITPFWHISEWHLTIRKVVLELGGQLKVFACTTSTDTTIDDALNGSFDLIFIQLPETPPPRLLERMSKCSDKIVTLFQDYTAYGIRSLEGAQISSVNVMMQTLLDRGHRSIDYIQILSAAPSRDLSLRRQPCRTFWISTALKDAPIPAACPIIPNGSSTRLNSAGNCWNIIRCPTLFSARRFRSRWACTAPASRRESGSAKIFRSFPSAERRTQG